MRSRECLIPILGLLALGGCTSDAHLRGDWDVTISLQSDNFVESYPGSASIRQFFTGIDGVGQVAGAGGETCEVYFDFSGRAFDEANIIATLSFGNSCSNSLLDDQEPVTLNFNLTREGDLLMGHATYGLDPWGDDMRLFFSATRAPY